MNLNQFINACRASHIRGKKIDGRLVLSRENGKIPAEILAALPDFENELLRRYSWPEYKTPEIFSLQAFIDFMCQNKGKILAKGYEHLKFIDMDKLINLTGLKKSAVLEYLEQMRAKNLCEMGFDSDLWALK